MMTKLSLHPNMAWLLSYRPKLPTSYNLKIAQEKFTNKLSSSLPLRVVDKEKCNN